MQQLLLLGFLQLSHGDTAPISQHLGNLRHINLIFAAGALFLPGGLAVFQLIFQLTLGVTPFGGLLKILGGNGRGFLLNSGLQTAFQLSKIQRGGLAGQINHGGSFIHQIDRFIGQKSVRQVTHRKGNGGLDGFAGDFYAVVCLITVTQALQNRNSLLLGRLAHHHRLKTPFQRSILLDILAVFINGGGAHTLQLSAGQGRL